ncbi:hypothetical protein CMK19_01135 [Candidatus Poribacteria bacterium]|nr:hypothetical protein [Candidatus Poribacteria bacterium]
MAQLTGGSFKRISPEDIKVRRSTLNQLVDIIQEDVSGSATRRTYQVFVTGGVGPGVTSSLFQTVYDQDYTLQTANPIFDLTVGLFESGSTVSDASTGKDSAGKLLFASSSVQMREKVDVYRQFAKNLLGDSDASFSAPFGDADTTNRIDNALFVSFKRLFARDKIKKETFAMRFYETGTMSRHEQAGQPARPTLNVTSESGSVIFTDIGAATNTRRTFGGDVANIVAATNTARRVGLIFYDQGTCVFDLNKIISGSQHASGTIDAMNAYSPDGTLPTGTMIVGHPSSGNPEAKFIPDFLVSASIDDITDHISSTRFSSGTLTAMTFQNVTTINSTLVFCRATADEFNYSTNPTYTNASGRIRVIDAGQEDSQRSFSFPTTIGLHDEFGNLLAVAKLSRPIEKNDERDVTFRVRLDF